MRIIDEIKLPQDIKKLEERQLITLAQEVREELINVVTVNGGHLASNLGIVELTIALLYVFDPLYDRLIFDVSHQSYVYKLLTGRKDEFSTLRTLGGISGFTNPKESECDVFISGHASTSISLGCGFARVDKLNNENKCSVSIIGDGALTGGMSYEALNEVVNIAGKQIIVINDNNMSISGNVGSTSRYLKKLRISKRYLKFKQGFSKFLDGFKFNGNKVSIRLQKLKNTIKYFINGKLPFDQYGIHYYGPIDGHNIKELITFLKYAKDFKEPIIIHVTTVKGKGYSLAEKSPELYHGINPAGCVCNNSFSSLVGNTLIDMAKLDEKVIVTTAAMPCGTGLEKYRNEFKSRFIDVGIAEQHAVTMNAAIARGGYKPYFAVYSTFLQRGFDQLIHDVSIMSLPVRFLIDRAGIVGEDGETHQGIFDISFMNMIPKFVLMSPMSGKELEMMLHWSLDINQPLAIRYPKSYCEIDCEIQDIKLGKWQYLIENDSNIVVIAVGADCVYNSYKAMDLTDKKFSLVNARFIKPLDTELLDSIKDKKIITVEDNIITGGFGSSVLEYYNDKNIKVCLKRIALPEQFIPHGKKDELFSIFGLDRQAIASTIDNI